MPITQAEAKAELAKRELARRHLLDFIIYNFPEYKVNWHHRLICEKLEAVEHGKIKRLMIFAPPRHGKSEVCSIQFPTWCIGRNKDRHIIEACYSADLAHDFGRQTRNLVASQAFKNVFRDVLLSEDSQSKGKWNTNGRGAYNAVGVGGAVTGKGADCIAAGAEVETENGKKKIEDIKVGDKILSFNHRKDRFEFKEVLKTRCIKDKDVVSLGGRFLCTPDHRIFDGDQYTTAKDCQFLYSYLPDTLRFLRSGFRETVDCLEEKTPRTFLFFCLRLQSGIKKVVSSMRRLWLCIEKRGEEALHAMSKKRISAEKDKTNQGMFSVREGFFGKALQKLFLFHRLQEQSSFSAHDGESQPSLEKWSGKSSLWSWFCDDSQKSQKEGSADMRGLFSFRKACSSFRRGQIQRQNGEFDNRLRLLPYNHPQKQELRSERIIPFGKRTVYDLQVAENHNFFVNGCLVHNCLIIDDPLKNRQDANSKLYRDNIWDWYRSTARTRLSPDGAIVLILTRWHEDDLAGRILAQGGEVWEKVELPAIAIEDDLYRKRGMPLWGDHFTLEVLNQIQKDIGSFEWSALYQQRPVDEESQEFKRSWAREIDWKVVEAKKTARYLTVDPAVSANDSADATGIVINLVDGENNWHFLARSYRVNPSELIQLLFKLHLEYSFDKIGIEKTVYLSAIKPFLDEEQRRKNIFLPIFELKHNQTQKEIRIRGLIPRYQAGGIFHIKGECKDLEEEMMVFPKGVHDDVLDAAAYQEQLVRPWTGGIRLTKELNFDGNWSTY